MDKYIISVKIMRDKKSRKLLFFVLSVKYLCIEVSLTIVIKGKAVIKQCEDCIQINIVQSLHNLENNNNGITNIAHIIYKGKYIKEFISTHMFNRNTVFKHFVRHRRAHKIFDLIRRFSYTSRRVRSNYRSH